MARISSASASGAASPSMTILAPEVCPQSPARISVKDAVQLPPRGLITRVPNIESVNSGGASSMVGQSPKRASLPKNYVGMSPTHEEGGGSWAGRSSEAVGEVVEDDRTTLHIKNIPKFYFTRAMMEALLDGWGLTGRYDFLYVPNDMHSRVAFGWAHVNLLTPEDAQKAFQYFDGFEGWPVPSKPAVVTFDPTFQGLDQLIDKYRNNSLMHSSVAEELRPARYLDGCWVPFPEPTKTLTEPDTKNARRKSTLKDSSWRK